MAPSRSYSICSNGQVLMTGSMRAVEPAFDAIVKYCKLHDVSVSDLSVVINWNKK